VKERERERERERSEFYLSPDNLYLMRILDELRPIGRFFWNILCVFFNYSLNCARTA